MWRRKNRRKQGIFCASSAAAAISQNNKNCQRCSRYKEEEDLKKCLLACWHPKKGSCLFTSFSSSVFSSLRNRVGRGGMMKAPELLAKLQIFTNKRAQWAKAASQVSSFPSSNCTAATTAQSLRFAHNRREGKNKGRLRSGCLLVVGVSPKKQVFPLLPSSLFTFPRGEHIRRTFRCRHPFSSSSLFVLFVNRFAKNSDAGWKWEEGNIGEKSSTKLQRNQDDSFFVCDQWKKSHRVWFVGWIFLIKSELVKERESDFWE